MITVSEARVAAQKRLKKNLSVWAAAAALDGGAVDAAASPAGASVAPASAKAADAASASADVTAPDASPAPAFELGLKPPTEKQVLANQSAAEAWVREWRDVESRRDREWRDAGAAAAGPALDWEPRSWKAVGRQSIPVRMRLTSADDVAEFVGGTTACDWRRLRDRAAEIHRRWPGDAPPSASASPTTPGAVDPGAPFAALIRAHASTLLALSDTDFGMVLDVVAWLEDHPLGTMRPRQLPIRGVDSKWFGTHRTLVTALLALAGADESLAIQDAEALVRIRICDPTLRPGGIRDITAPVDQLSALELKLTTVLVFENLESVLALPDLPGVIAVHGSGYAVDAVARIGWATSARVLYWGDLDSHGFAILGRLRSHLSAITPRTTAAPQPAIAGAQPTAAGTRTTAESILMDESTLLAHRDLWVPEPKPHTGAINHLTDGELRALERLRTEGDVRLEQERIPWATALAEITRRLARP